MQCVRAWLLMMYLSTRKKKKNFLYKPSDYSQMLSPILYTRDRTRRFEQPQRKDIKKLLKTRLNSSWKISKRKCRNNTALWYRSHIYAWLVSHRQLFFVTQSCWKLYVRSRAHIVIGTPSNNILTTMVTKNAHAQTDLARLTVKAIYTQ